MFSSLSVCPSISLSVMSCHNINVFYIHINLFRIESIANFSWKGGGALHPNIYKPLKHSSSSVAEVSVPLRPFWFLIGRESHLNVIFLNFFFLTKYFGMILYYLLVFILMTFRTMMPRKTRYNILNEAS